MAGDSFLQSFDSISRIERRLSTGEENLTTEEDQSDDESVLLEKKLTQIKSPPLPLTQP
jgi:hypothetical protein